MKPSQNQIAEMLFRTTALDHRKRRPTARARSSSGRSRSGASPPSEAVVRDGSGLVALRLHLAAHRRARARRDARGRRRFQVYYDALPIARRRRHDSESHERHAGRAATCTRRRARSRMARSLSGYVTTADRQHAHLQLSREQLDRDHARSVETRAGRDRRAARRRCGSADVAFTRPGSERAHPRRRFARSASEPVPLRDALGRVLARATCGRRSSIRRGTTRRWTATRCARPTSRAAIAPSPVVLPVLETVRAGRACRRAPLEPGTAIRIMTGAPVPDGADTVIRVEDTDGGDDARRDPRRARRRSQRAAARRRSSPSATLAVRRRHADRPGAARRARVGRLRVRSPVHRTPARRHPDVGRRARRRRPLRRSAPRRPHRVVEQLHDRGRRRRSRAPRSPYLGIVPDDPAAYRRAISPARTGCDLADHDGRRVRRRIRLHERRASRARRRSPPVARAHAPRRAARLRHASAAMPWLGLPGQSGVGDGDVRALRAAGDPPAPRRARRLPSPDRTCACATTCRSPRRSRTSCARSSTWEDGGAWARLTGPQGSGLLTSMSRANALLVVPPDRPLVRAGETARAILLGDRALSSPSLSL